VFAVSCVYKNMPCARSIKLSLQQSQCPIQNGLKQGDSLSPLLFNFASQYSIKKVQEHQVGPKLNGTQQFVVCANDVNESIRR
jgi:hypothetical protein